MVTHSSVCHGLRLSGSLAPSERVKRKSLGAGVTWLRLLLPSPHSERPSHLLFLLLEQSSRDPLRTRSLRPCRSSEKLALTTTVPIHPTKAS